MKKLLLAALLVTVVLSSQYVPIPKREIGIFIGSPSAQVKLEFIYDPVCDGTAEFDATFQQAWNSLAPELRQRISLRFLSLPLPYHIASQKLSQAILYVQQAKGNQQALTLFRDFLTHLDDNDEDNIRNETVGGLMIRTAQRVNNLFGLKTEDVFKQLAHGSAFDVKVRQMSKYVMGSIRASGTPKMRINGVTVDGVTSLSVQQLADLIKSLFINSE